MNKSEIDEANANLPAKKREALTLLAAGASATEAAATIGVSRSCVYNWCRADPVFRAALASAQNQQAAIVADRLQSMAETSLGALDAMIRDPATPAGVRLRAIDTVLRAVTANDPYRQRVEPSGMTAADKDKLMEAAFAQGASERVLNDILARFQDPEPAGTAAPSSGGEASPAAVQSDAIPRGAPCPCGSGVKFKRCCGHDAPGVHGPPRSMAA